VCLIRARSAALRSPVSSLSGGVDEGPSTIVRAQQAAVIATLNLLHVLRGICSAALLLAALANPGLNATGKKVAGMAGAGPQGATASGGSGSAALQEIVAAGRLSDLRWPDFSDYRNLVKDFYDPVHYSPAWLQNNLPTQPAQRAIEVLQQADSKGLNAEDYDASRWPQRLARLQSSGSPADQARFDAALTVCLMRYISDLHIGRVNPRRVNFNLDVGSKKYNLPSFLREKIVNGGNILAELSAVEPPFEGYKRTQKALQHYLELSRQDDGEQLPVPTKPLEPGGSYDGTRRLARLLSLLADLPPGSAVPENSNLYDARLAAAVRHFQERHGLVPDGRLGTQTVKQLNVPLSFRVQQLRLTLERWRWVPYEFKQPPIVVNIPAFRLRAYDKDGTAGLLSNVIVGKSYRHQTPVFERDMKFVVFRPYWNVPPSILRSEIVPAIKRDRYYIAKKGYEVTTSDGTLVSSGAITDNVLQQLSSGKLQVRQKPGPSNALGLVKLMFPNEYNVYLHSTPSSTLFSQSRRDFSHGCIRVEKSAELAAWVLRDKPEWTLERVRTAMQSGSDDLSVALTNPIPVLILYGTAVVDEQQEVHFFDDIYQHDSSLEKALAKGYPYPW
jgi:L,D-transpeptidase YcbB